MNAQGIRLAIGGVALLSLLAPAGADAQLCDYCDSSVTASSGVVLACPRGDGDALGTSGLTIDITVRDCFGPISGVPATDIWFIGCSNLLVLCGGSAAIHADGPTDANGHTTISGPIAAGGCDTGGILVIVQGVVIPGPVCGVSCVPIKVKSCDLTGDLVVTLQDLAQFSAVYTSPPKAYNECADYRAPFGTVTLADFAVWGVHYSHAC